MAKITSKHVASGLMIGLVAVAAVSIAGGTETKTITYGGGGGMESGGAGTEYGYDLDTSFTDWINSLPQPENTQTTEEPSILDVPSIIPTATAAPTAAPTAANGGFIESLLKPPSKETLTAAATAAPVAMFNPIAGLGVFTGNILGQKFAQKYTNNATIPAGMGGGGGGLRSEAGGGGFGGARGDSGSGGGYIKVAPAKTGSVSAYSYAYSHNPDGTYNGALTSAGTTPNGTYKASKHGSVTIRNNE